MAEGMTYADQRGYFGVSLLFLEPHLPVLTERSPLEEFAGP